jgi:hypothetical protein
MTTDKPSADKPPCDAASCVLYAHVRDQRESLDLAMSLINETSHELREIRVQHTANLTRINTLESVMNDSFRLLHELKATLSGVDREQQIIAVQAMKTVMTTEDMQQKLVQHIHDETVSFETYNRKLIKMVYVLTGVIIMAHGVAAILNDTPLAETISSLLGALMGG